MWELLIHSTGDHNIKSIIKDKYIKANDPYYGDSHEFNDNKQINSTKGVYMSLLFDSLMYNDKYWHYNSYMERAIFIIFGFDTSMLKTYSFKICPYAGYGTCDDHLLDGNGKLNKKPNLSKIKNHINDTIKHEIKNKWMFTSSHEIIFNDNIPLSLCKCIFVYKNNKYIPFFKEIYPQIKIIFITLKTTFMNLSQEIKNII
jgi:hypothetical protein